MPSSARSTRAKRAAYTERLERVKAAAPIRASKSVHSKEERKR
jgi:hypothetical protein